MQIRDISVCLASPDGDKAAFEFARDVAAAHNAHLSCAAFTILPQIVIGYGDAVGAEMYATLIQETRTAMTEAWDRFEDQSLRTEDTIELRRFEVMQNRVEALSAMNARHADLVVVTAPGADDEQPHADMLEGALLGGGRPVLVLPAGWKKPVFGKRTVMAWDGGREASRALHDSLMVMPQGALVLLTTVDAKPGETGYGAGPGWDIGAHLARHGCTVEVRNEDSIGRSTAEALLDVATAYDADLIVMGGYRHPRLQQAVMGGVTRKLVREAKVPLLLSH
ncbi:MAG: universal stress protein [Hyphomonas sp.]